MRPRRSTQEYPPDLPPIMPPDVIDHRCPLDVPDEARMQVAAYRYHLQRILDTEGIDYANDRGELPIITLLSAFPSEVAPGWWEIGDVCDAHDGLRTSHRVYWQPATDRVKIDGLPPPASSLPETELRPITMDGNYRLHVADGWHYWHDGRQHSAEQARAILCRSGVREHVGWTWERLDAETER